MSHKVSARVNGTFSVGAQGFGFLAGSPCTANDSTTAYKTASSFAAQSIVIDSSVLPPTGDNSVTQVNNTALPYDKDLQIDGTPGTPSSYRARIVSFGMRVRYIGTTLDMGGRMVAFVNPSHSNLNGSTFDMLASRKGSVRLPVSREWTDVVMIGTTTDEMEYPGLPYNASGSGMVLREIYPFSNYEYVHVNYSQNGGVPIAVAVESKAKNQFEYEIITHVEYIGMGVAATATRSHCDLAGLSAVHEIQAETKAKRSTSTVNYRTMASSAAHALGGFVWRNREAIGSMAQVYMRRRGVRAIEL